MKPLSLLSGAVRIACLLALSVAAASAQAAAVALFADTTYVDYDPGNISSEASNLQASLAADGHAVNTFTGVSEADWSTALSAADVLAIPEQERRAIYPDLDAGAVTAVQNFVNNGGVLLVTADHEDFLNSIFAWTLDLRGAGESNLVTANAAGTSFDGGPDPLPWNNATTGYGNFPAGSTCMYEDSAGSCVVLTVTRGIGTVIVLGWDWFDAAPTGGQDGGWLDVLSRSMAFHSAPPAAHSIPTLGWPGLLLLSLLLLGFGVRRRGASLHS